MTPAERACRRLMDEAIARQVDMRAAHKAPAYTHTRAHVVREEHDRSLDAMRERVLDWPGGAV